MSRKQLYIITAAVVIALALLASWFGLQQTKDTAPTNTTEQSTTTNTDESQNGALRVTNDGRTVEYDGVEGQTALATLKSLADVTTNETEFGEFVTGINGVMADGQTEYWSFYVNDTFANVGAGEYVAKAGDVIEWRVEKVEL